jgi:hypothetical protein
MPPLARAASHQYIFFDRERERISDPVFLATKKIEGAQLKYTWRELEPEKGKYDFAAIQHDFDLLKANGKKLFVQLQDVSFATNIINVPKYIVEELKYHGGADYQYSIPDDDESKAIPAGWVARRWDRSVQERFHKLLLALGEKLDGKIEGMNLPETAVDFGESGRLFPKSFTPETYRDSIISNLVVLKRAFPRSVTMIYANFMPGEWLPENDRSYLREIFHQARTLKVGVGGPDLLPFRPAQMKHSYPLIRDSAGIIPTGIAVQWGNYENKNATTGQRNTISELFDFAEKYLKVDYIFWSTQEPYYSKDLIALLQAGNDQ